jgi:hypothetical protein
MKGPFLKNGSTEEMAELYKKSYDESLRCSKSFEDVKTYCMFIGYPRSGHSLVGALLDAHPDMVIGHELDALMYVQAGFSKMQIYYLLLESARAFAATGCTRTGYSYAVPNQWQGKFRKIRIIGDKKGGGRSNKRLRENPELLSLLQKTIDVRIKFIHVIRNPYDNISTMSQRKSRLDLRSATDKYFEMCATIANIKKHVSRDDMFDLRHESFIDNPKFWLAKICDFLGAESLNGYLDACAGIVYKSPHKSRHETPWSDELLDVIMRKKEQFPFLEGYAFEE